MDRTLHYLLMADHTILQKQLFARIRGSGLTMGQPKVLDYLKNHDGAVQKEVAKGCHIEPATLSTVLTGMEKKGIITRGMSDDNRRNLKVSLTDKGRELCEFVSQKFQEIERKAFSGFSAEEAAELNGLLARIYSNLEA